MADKDSTTVEEGGKEKTDKGEVTEVKDNVDDTTSLMCQLLSVSYY